TPCHVRRYFPFAEGMIERRPQHREIPVSGCASAPDRLGISINVVVLLRLAFCGAQPWRCLRQCGQPRAQSLGGKLADFKPAEIREDKSASAAPGVVSRLAVMF